MAWARLNSGNGPLVAVQKSGNVVFNDEAYILMGCPKMVSLFHDSAAGLLGFRQKHETDQEAVAEFCMFNSEADEHTLSARTHLDGAGLIPRQNWEAELQVPPGVPPGSVQHDMYYVELP